MEQDEPLDPTQTGILGVDTEMPQPSRAAHLLQEWGGAVSMAHVENPPWRVYAARMCGNRFRRDGQHWQSSGDGVRLQRTD